MAAATAKSPLDRFQDELLDAAWGTLSKGELEFLIFALLVRTGRIDIAGTDFDIANALLTTPTRIRSLRYRFEQEAVQADPEALDRMIVPANFAFEAAAGDRLRVQVRSRYLRELLFAKLAARRAIPMAELAPNVLVAQRDDVVAVLVDLSVQGAWFETEEGAAAQRALVEELTAIRDADEYGDVVDGWLGRIKDGGSIASGLVNVLRLFGLL
jgi:hypothetical protein